MNFLKFLYFLSPALHSIIVHRCLKEDVLQPATNTPLWACALAGHPQEHYGVGYTECPCGQVCKKI